MVLDIEHGSLEKHFKGKKLAVFDGDGTLCNIFLDSWLFLSRKRGEYLYDQGVQIKRSSKLTFKKYKNSQKKDDKNTLQKETPYKTKRRRMGDQFVHAHNKIYSDYLVEVEAGKSNAYLSMKTKLLKLWTKDGEFPLTREFITQEVVNKIPLRRGVVKVFTLLSELGFKVGVITASFDLYAKRLNDNLPLDFCISNTPLDFNNTGQLEDFIQKGNFEKTKRLELSTVAEDFNISLEKMIAFGDGETDIEIFWDITGIAVCSQNRTLLESSAVAVTGFKKVIRVLESLVSRREAS